MTALDKRTVVPSLVAITTVALQGLMASAHAQATATEGESRAAGSGLEEVVVTAERRSQKLSEVPLSIVALGEEALQQKRIEGTEALARNVAGMNFFRNRLGRFKVTVRGIGGSAGPDMSQNYKVAVFVDDVYIDRPAAMDLAYFDLNRVEVLRGPQGTLYGKNAIGGALNIHTNPPSDTPELAARVDYGNYDILQTRLLATGPLGDAVAGKLVLGSNEHSGFTENITTGHEQSVQRNIMGRGELLFTPGDWDITLSGSFEHNPNQPGKAYRITGPTGHMPFDVYGPNFSPEDPYKITNDHDTRSSMDVELASLRAIHSGEALTFTSISGYVHSDLYFTWDPDATDSRITGVSFNQTENQNARTLSQEFRLNSTEGGTASLGGRLFWTAGLYYFQLDGDMSSLETNYFPDNQIVDVPPGTELAQVHTMGVKGRNWATYAQATYNLTEQLHLTGGLRYDYEEKAVVQTASGDELISDNYTDFHNKDSYSKATPKVTLDYKIVDGVMVYATYSQGFLSGGFNFAPETTQNANAFGPETATNYEVGLKTVLWDGRASFNLTGFYVDYSDLQVAVVNPNTQLQETRNAASAVSQGVEADFAMQLTDNLEIDMAYSYTDAHYEKFCDGVPQAAATLSGAACIDAGGEDLKGEPLEGYAQKTARAGFRYRWPLNSGSQLSLRGDWSWQSPTIFPGYTQPAYSTADAGIDFISPTERYQVGLWGHNLTDEIYVTGCSGFGNTDNGANCTISDPRTYGISLRVRFR